MYTAVTSLTPTGSVATVSVATPAVSSGLLPSGPLGRVKVTLPVGAPVPLRVVVTVAVKVTGWPKKEGQGALASAVVVAAGNTVSSTGNDSLARWFGSPA